MQTAAAELVGVVWVVESHVVDVEVLQVWPDLSMKLISSRTTPLPVPAEEQEERIQSLVLEDSALYDPVDCFQFVLAGKEAWV